MANERAIRAEAARRSRASGGRKVSLEDVFAGAERGESRSSTSCSRPTSPARSRRSRTRSRKLPQDQVQVNVIRAGVGGITESDVMLAAASDAIDHRLQRAPRRQRRAGRRARGRRDPHLLGHLQASSRTCATRWRACSTPRRSRRSLGDGRGARRSSGPRASARSPAATSPTARSRRGARCRLVRDGTVVYDGRIGSLRRFKDDVREVDRGHGVRHRARELPRRQGGRRDRGLRDASRSSRRSRSRSWLSADRRLLEIRLHFPDTRQS